MKEGWEYKKLGKIGVVITGNTPSTKDNRNYESEDYCFIKPSDILKDGITKLNQSEYHISEYAFDNSRKLPKGSVLTTCIGIIGKVGILQIDATCNQQINAIIPSPLIDSSFLAYTILSSRQQLEKIANAPVVPIINKKEFSNITIPVPPLSEQQHIVKELDLLSSIIEKKKAQLNELDNLAQSLFYEMFGDPITNDKGWEVMTLEAISHLITDGSHYSPKDDAKGVIPMLSVKDMRQTHFSYGTCKWIGKVEYNKLVANGCKPLKDDVLIAKDGSFFKYIFVLTQEREQAILSSIAILRPKVSLVNPHYVARYLSTKEIFSKVEREYLTGTAIKRVILKGIRKMPIILPSLSLQQQFASKIKAIENQKELIKQSIKEVETLFNSRMDYYFN